MCEDLSDHDDYRFIGQYEGEKIRPPDPSLTPTRTQLRATPGKPEKRKPLKQKEFDNLCNA